MCVGGVRGGGIAHGSISGAGERGRLCVGCLELGIGGVMLAVGVGGRAACGGADVLC